MSRRAANKLPRQSAHTRTFTESIAYVRRTQSPTAANRAESPVIHRSAAPSRPIEYRERYRQAMQKCPKDMELIFSAELLDDAQRKLLFRWNRQHQDRLRKIFSYAIPNEEALAVIAQFSPLVEIGAGTGYWAYLLQQRNAIVYPYDAIPPCKTQSCQPNLGEQRDMSISTEEPEMDEDDTQNSDTKEQKKENDQDAIARNRYHPNASTFVPVQKGGPEVLSQHPDCQLFLCWPPDFCDMASECLKHYHGQYVIYIGESIGRTMHDGFGLTGDLAFHMTLARDFHEILRIPLDNWPGTMDCLSVYKRTSRCYFAGQFWRHIPTNERLSLRAESPAGLQLLSQSASRLSTEMMQEPAQQEAQPQQLQKPQQCQQKRRSEAESDNHGQSSNKRRKAHRRAQTKERNARTVTKKEQRS